MTTWQARLLAIGAWLVAIALTIPFAALWDEYSTMRAGTEVTGHVTRTERRAGYLDATVSYDGGGRHGEVHTYPPQKDAGSFKVGAPVTLIVSGRGAFRPDYVENQRPSILLVFGAALALVLGGVAWTAPTREAKRRAARTSPLDVVVEGIRRTRNTVNDLLIWDTKGKRERIRMVPEDAEALLAELARRAPHATRGYSPELERQYKERYQLHT